MASRSARMLGARSGGMCAQLRCSSRGRATVHKRHCRAWHSFAVQVLRSLVTAPVCALGKRTGSDPGSTACEAAGDVDAWPRLRPHPGLPSLGAPLHLLAQALEWTHGLNTPSG